MATGRLRLIAPMIALATMIPFGCAQPGPFSSRQASLGTLKSSVSQLEFENQDLKKQVAELKTENARMDSDLAREEAINGDVTARLDDARDRLRKQGGDATALGGSSRTPDDEALPPPAKPRSSRTNSRKPPAASIPRAEEGADSEPSLDAPLRLRDPGPQTSADDDRWLPVARGLGSVVR